MTVRELAERLGAEVLVEGDLSREVQTGYAGDLLSWVMACLPEGAVWMTVMGNLNAIAVCSLKDGACILLTEDAPLDENAKQRAGMEEIPVLRVADGSYRTSLRVADLLGETP